MVRIIAFEELGAADLIIDAVYEGGGAGHSGDDPISKVLPGVGNRGGFRAAGRGDDKRFVVLYTSGEDSDWPDHLDLNTGQFVYYGDNKTPGHELHDTGRGGNRLLRRAFDQLHATATERSQISPFFVFKKYPTPRSTRSVQFQGLAVPGFRGLPATSDLVAVWKTTDGQRFQNYRATFTILDVPVVDRTWLDDLSAGTASNRNAPGLWCGWLRLGRYEALTSESTTVIRTQQAQTPDTRAKLDIVKMVWHHFKDLDLVLCTASGAASKISPLTLPLMADEYEIRLTPPEKAPRRALRRSLTAFRVLSARLERIKARPTLPSRSHFAKPMFTQCSRPQPFASILARRSRHAERCISIRISGERGR